MPLEAGTAIGSYEIVAPLGAGGMGEVYRARDPKLEREVAIKVLPEGFAENQERLARFEREAKSLAALSHPNIATIFGFEEFGGTHFLVMELAPGEDLAERISRGPIPVDEAIPLFAQIAEGLEAAHEKGIVHRDLKPANIKVSPDGRVKILDFGLAKAMEPDSVSLEGDLSQSPTMTAAATMRGEILGTAAYMSPEQASGKPVDKRTDIWALGACLYEALTGERLFQGEDAPNTVAAVLRDEVDLARLPAGTPPPVRRLLERCLARDARRRLRDAGDAGLELEEALGWSDGGVESPGAVGSVWRPRLEGALAGLLLAGLVGALWFLGSPRESARILAPTEVRRSSLQLPESAPVALASAHPFALPRTALTISPDGSTVVYTADLGDGVQLYRRDLDAFEALPIPGTEGGFSPSFSPDGREIAFLTRGNLNRIPLEGGEARVVVEARNAARLHWGGDGDFYLARDDGSSFVRVDAAAREVAESFPIATGSSREPLPGGGYLCLSSDDATSMNRSAVAVAFCSVSGEVDLLGPRGFSPRYVSSGHLLYVRGNSLFAVGFDLESHAVTGDEVQVLGGVWSDSIAGTAYFDVSEEGTLVYVAGEDWSRSVPTWIDRSGAESPLAMEAASYNNFGISHDGSRLATTVTNVGVGDVIRIFDFARGLPTTLRIEAGPGESSPMGVVWAAEGDRVFYTRRLDSGLATVFQMAVNRQGEEMLLISGEDLGVRAPVSGLFSYAASRDGRYLTVNYAPPEQRSDVWRISLADDEEPQPLVSTPSHEVFGTISPDGRWLAYASNKTGTFDVFVRSLEDGTELVVSSGGGEEPLWSDAGDEIFYRTDDRIMAVSFTAESEPPIGSPRVMVKTDFHNSGGLSYGVSPDGERFLVNKPVGAGRAVTEIRVVENWLEELKRLAP